MLKSVKGRLCISYSCMKWLSRNVPLRGYVRNSSGCCQKGEENLPKREANFGRTLLPDVAPVQLDLDVGSLLAYPMELDRNVQLRGLDHINIIKLAKDYMEFKMIDFEKQELERERENISEEIQKLIQAKENRDENAEKKLREKGRKIREKYKPLVSKFNSHEEKMTLAALKLPNKLSPDTPETEYKVLKEYTASGSEKYQNVSHMDLAVQENLIKVSDIGDKAFYYKGELAVLEQVFIQEFGKKLDNSGFTQLTSMEMFKEFVLEGCGVHLEDNYKVQQFVDASTDYYIRGNSVMTFAAFLSKMLIHTEILPLKLFSYGRSYRPVSSATVQLPDLSSSTQSVKASILYTCASEDSASHCYKEAQSLLWDLYCEHISKYNLNARLVMVPAKNLELSEQSRIDLQVWLPSQQNYLTIASVSFIGDYISRRLTIRHTSNIKSSKSTSLVHMVYGEILNVNRLIAVLLEHGLK